MAKDPNSSDNGNNPNEIGSSLTDRVSEIGQAAYRVPAEERELRRKAKEARRGVNVYENLGDVARQYEPIQKFHKQNVNTLSRTEPRIRIGAEARLERYTQQAQNEVNRAFDDTRINGMVNEMSKDQGVQAMAQGMVGTPYGSLASRSAAIRGEMNSLRGRASEVTEGLLSKRGVDPQRMSELGLIDRQLQDKAREMAPINSAMRLQRQLGMDPESRMSALAAKGQAAATLLGQSNESGGRLKNLSMGQLQELEANQAKKLVDALKELEDAAKKGATNLDDLQKKAEKTAENLGKTQDAMAGGGGGRGGRDSFMAYANIAQAGFGAAAGAVQQIGVNQRLAQAQNATGYASFENQKYQTYKSAASGDIASLMLLSQFSGAEGFGASLKGAANTAVSAQLAGGMVQTAAGVVDIASTLNAGENALSTSAAQANREKGIINTMEGVATTAVAGSDLARGVSGGQADIAARQARLEVGRAINAVGAEQMQGFRDFGVGMGSAAIGMGGAGENFLRRSISDSTMTRMTAARMSPEQMAQMAQMGVANMGSTFNESQIFAARGLESRGLGTMQENMQRMSALAGAGANNPQTALAGVLEVALGKGLDSSKALNAVADHTAQMAATSSGRALGIDTTSAAASLLMAGIGKDTPNKEAALERAASIQDRIQSIGTNTDVSYAGMVATARIRGTTGLGGVSSILAQGIDTQTLMSLQGMSPDKQRDALTKSGVDMRGRDSGKLLSALIEDRQMTLLEGKGSGFAVNYDKGSVLKAARAGKSFDELPEDQRLALSQVAGLQGMKGPELFAAVTGATQKTNPNAPAGTAAMTIATDNSMRTQLDKMRTMGFEQLSTAAQTAAQNLGGASAAIGKLTVAFEGLEKAMPNMEKSATTAAGRAAGGEKGLNVDGFNIAIGKLDKVLQKALDRSGMGSISTDSKSKSLPPHQ